MSETTRINFKFPTIGFNKQRSYDPVDFNTLTPNHSLTLVPSTIILDPDLSTVRMFKLQRWWLIRDIHQHFWSKWQTDYKNTLWQCTKWTTQLGILRQNQLILFKELTNLFNGSAVLFIYPRTDGISHVALLKQPPEFLKVLPTNCYYFKGRYL